MQPRTVLDVLAELAPAAGERTLDVSRGSQALVWLETAEKAPRDKASERLAALDALHREERILHRGWGFLAGRIEIEGKPRKIRLPLLSQPVHLERSLIGYKVVAAGDVEVTPLVEDRELAAALEAAPGLATPGWLDAIGSHAWLRSVADATGLPVGATVGPKQRVPADGLVLVAAPALYVVRDVFGAGLADSLRNWAGRDLSGTALAAVYASEASIHLPNRDSLSGGDPVLSPLPLTGAQSRVVVRARSEAVTVVSGPPGSGKSHTVVAAALEVVDRGGSVLVATQSPHAAEVLAGLLARYPGPPPVLFGDARGHAGLEAELTAGTDQGVEASVIRAGRQRVKAAFDLVRARRSALRRALELEQRAAALPAWQPLLPHLATEVPGAFDDDVDLDEVRTLLTAAGLHQALRVTPSTTVRQANPGSPSSPASGPGGGAGPGEGVPDSNSPGGLWGGPAAGLGGWAESEGGLSDANRRSPAGRLGGWWGRRRARVARGRAYRLLGAADGVPEAIVFESLAAATAQRAAAHLAATGGTDLGAAWSALHAAEQDLREAAGQAMRDGARSAERWNRDGRRAAGALAAALRAGRNRRRELLARMEAAPLVRALPLWIGTVADVEDLLPPEPGLFDLVVIDEASHVDQIRAAPVLARARRALIVGDPRQLRFVSFVSDVDVTQVLDRHGADERLDVRRVSTYDLATAVAPVTWLAEHHRSVPHLIDFPARRFYGDRVSVMTRTPLADATDAIDVVAVPDAAAEVPAALAAVERLAAEGFRGIGVISPFRAQAEALEAALLKAMPAERIEELRLRVGTVHAFQGSEADAVIVSPALADGDSPSRRRFVTDPRLFNVMVTRARRRLIVLTSLTAPTGLLGDYLQHAEGPRAAQEGAEPAGWAAELATELKRLEVAVRPGYRVGPWTLDLCVGDVGVFCAVHPDGPAAHLERQGALHRAGWRLVDAFPSRWHGDVRRAALEIAALC